MKDTMHKLWRGYQWTMLWVVKPLVILWLVIQGVPPAIRALCGGVNSIIKTCEKGGRK